MSEQIKNPESAPEEIEIPDDKNHKMNVVQLEASMSNLYKERTGKQNRLWISDKSGIHPEISSINRNHWQG